MVCLVVAVTFMECLSLANKRLAFECEHVRIVYCALVSSSDDIDNICGECKYHTISSPENPKHLFCIHVKEIKDA